MSFESGNSCHCGIESRKSDPRRPQALAHKGKGETMGTAPEVKHLQDMTMAELEAEFDRAMAEASLPRVNTCIHAAVNAVDNESRIREAYTVAASLEFLMGAYRRISTRFGNSDREATKKLFRQIRVTIIKNYACDFLVPLWVKAGHENREAARSRRDRLVVAFFAEYGFTGLESKDMAGFEEYLHGLWQKREADKATGHAPHELIETTINAGAFGLLTNFGVLEAIPYIFNSLLVHDLAFTKWRETRSALALTAMPLPLYPIVLEPADREKIEVLCATILRLERRCNPHPCNEVFKGARALLELLARYTLNDWEMGQLPAAPSHKK